MPSQRRESIINSNSGHRHMKRVNVVQSKKQYRSSANVVQSKKEYRSSQQSMKSAKCVRKCYRKAQKHAGKQLLIADIRAHVTAYLRSQAELNIV